MGQAKRQMEEQDELFAEAVVIAQRAGALEPCGLHEDELLYAEDEDADRRAYAMATKALQKGEVSGNRADLMEAIKRTFEWHSTSCSRCDNMFRED